MKTFLLNTLKVSALCIVAVIALFFIARLLVYDSSFKIDSSKNIAIIGDSHVECAFDDNILTRSYNFSTAQSQYPFVYFKAKRLIEDNPQIDTLVLSYWEGPLGGDLISGNDLQTHIKFIALYTDLGDLFKLPLNYDLAMGIIKSPVSPATIIRLSNLVKGKNTVEYYGLGKYNKSKRFRLKKNIELRGETVSNAKIDTTTILYAFFKEIQSLCKKNNVHIILFNAPIYQVDKYTDRAKFDSLRNEYLKGVDYLDFSDFPLPDSCYGDITHVNYLGAEVVSTYLQKYGFTRDSLIQLGVIENK